MDPKQNLNVQHETNLSTPIAPNQISPVNTDQQKKSRIKKIFLILLLVILVPVSPLLIISTIAGISLMSEGAPITGFGSVILFMFVLIILFFAVGLPILILAKLIKLIAPKIKSDKKAHYHLVVFAIVLNLINFLAIATFFLDYRNANYYYNIIQYFPFATQNSFLICFGLFIFVVYLTSLFLLIPKIIYNFSRTLIYLIASGISILFAGLEIKFLLLIVASLSSIFVLNSPLKGAMYDAKRVSGISETESLINYYARNNDRLPNSLNDLEPLQTESTYPKNPYIDPETLRTYDFNKLSYSTYEICAKFATDNTKKKSLNVHRKGYYCYQGDAKIYLPPEPISNYSPLNCSEFPRSNYPTGYPNEKIIYIDPRFDFKIPGNNTQNFCLLTVYFSPMLKNLSQSTIENLHLNNKAYLSFEFITRNISSKSASLNASGLIKFIEPSEFIPIPNKKVELTPYYNKKFYLEYGVDPEIKTFTVFIGGLNDPKNKVKFNIIRDNPYSKLPGNVYWQDGFKYY